jgi:hypothetical protein
MGVVFGLFAGFYYWIEYLTGLKYSDLLGRLHFWLTFVGVNLTFFPMHFLGIAGMPRRIPDYPDIYWAWNYISSVGSLVSVIGILVFFWLILNMYWTNNLYFQVYNDRYIIIINTWFKNLINEYVFFKFNYFQTKKIRFSFNYLDSWIINLFLTDEDYIEIYSAYSEKEYYYFQNIKNYTIFKDLAKNICNQWLPFCYLIYLNQEEYKTYIRTQFYHMFSNILLTPNINGIFPKLLLKLIKEKHLLNYSC